MIYAAIVAVLSLLGAIVPLRARPTHAGLQVYLSLAAGALLGAAMFHLLPHAAESMPHSVGLPAVAGILTVFLLQRYLAPHSHEIPSVSEAMGGERDGHQSHAPNPVDRPPAHDQNEGTHHHDEHCAGHGHGSTRSKPSLWSGAMAIVGLSIHSLFDGVAIGAALGGPSDATSSLALAVFLSVMIHKPMDGLSVSAILLNAGVDRGTLWIIQVIYAALVPIGAGLFLLTEGTIAESATLIGWTLAFSGGAFLAIALTDLLPELHFHSHDRNKLSAALLLGLGVMWSTTLFEHGHGHDHDHAPAAADHDHRSSDPNVGDHGAEEDHDGDGVPDH